MTEFRRLIDECDSELGQAILRAGREDSSDSRRARVLTAIGVGAAVSMTTKASFAMSALYKGALWKKLVLGGVVAASGVVGVAAYRSSTPEAIERAEQSLVAAAEDARAWGSNCCSKADTQPVASDELEALTSDVEPPARGARSGGRGSRDSSVAGLAGVAGLNEELALLDRARSSVRAGRPSDALMKLDEHAARFPKGSLALEAQVLRVQALAAAGRTEEASRRAKRILSRSPNSVVAQRLRQYVLE